MVYKYEGERYVHDPRNFGGLVYEGDFNTTDGAPRFRGLKGSTWAARIESDYRFDNMCYTLSQHNKNNGKKG